MKPLDETITALYARQLVIRDKIAACGRNVDAICEGERKRGKVIADQWENPMAQAKQIQRELINMQKALGDLIANIGAEEMVRAGEGSLGESLEQSTNRETRE
tara:strand:- start:6845 stop:7153 length:309 start_codon:yes stop_codon:yes gene_type:complete